MDPDPGYLYTLEVSNPCSIFRFSAALFNKDLKINRFQYNMNRVTTLIEISLRRQTFVH